MGLVEEGDGGVGEGGGGGGFKSMSPSTGVDLRGAAVEWSVRGDRAATVGGSEERRRRGRNTESDLDNREVIYKRDREAGKKAR